MWQKNLFFGKYMIYGNILEITEKQCVKERYPHSKAKIRFVQHCAAISAIAELYCSFG